MILAYLLLHVIHVVMVKFSLSSVVKPFFFSLKYSVSLAKYSHAMTQNNCLIKGSHKYDAYLFHEIKILSTDQIKTTF